MSSTTSDVMQKVSELALQSRLQKLSEMDMSAIKYNSLSEEQIDILAVKINLLPIEYQNILFFRYCFGNKYNEIDNLLGIENTKEKLLYIQDSLSRIMKSENLWIDDNSLKKSCKLALKESMKDYNNVEILHRPTYSKSFRKKLKGIKIIQNPNRIFAVIWKKVAVLVLVCFLSFSTVLVVNADVREKFFGWVVETFPKFSIFTPESIEEDNSSDDSVSFKINYVPEGFQLQDVQVFRNMSVYKYSNDNDELIIHFYSSERKGKSYYDTENVEVEEFVFKDSPALTWQTDKMTYLIWYQDDVECHIYGSINKEEIFKIAENITK